MLTSKDAILGACAAFDKPVPLEIPEWGECVLLRHMSAAEAAEVGRIEGRKAGAIAARVLADAEGRRLFADDDAEALEARIQNTPMERIVREALAMNVLDRDVEADVEAELDGDAQNPTA